MNPERGLRPSETFVEGLDEVYGLEIIPSMIEEAPEPLATFVERYGPPRFTEVFQSLRIEMWAWEGQSFNRPSDLAYGNLYVADAGEHRLVFRRNAPSGVIVD